MSNMQPMRQRGVSLISTMVGLGLGLIAIVGMLSVYKSLVYRNVDIRTSAKQDAQVSAGLIALNVDVQKAGFGIESNPSCSGPSTQGPSAAVNTDLIIIDNAVLSAPLTTSSTLAGTAKIITSTATTGTAAVWHWIDPTLGSLCGGVVATQGTLSPRKGGGLVRLTPMTCTNATQWNSLTWSLDYLIADDTLPPAITAVAATSSAPAIPATNNKAVAFSALTSICTPYGAGTATSAVLLTVTAGNSTMNLASSSTLCLPNICQ